MLWRGVVGLSLLVFVLAPGEAWAGSCSFQCQPQAGTTNVGRAQSQGPLESSSESDCRLLCGRNCGASLEAVRRTAPTATTVSCVTASVRYSSSLPLRPEDAASATPDCGRAAVAARSTPAGAGVSADIRETWVCALPRNDRERGQCRGFAGCVPLNAEARCCPPGVGNAAIGRAASSTSSASAESGARGLSGRLNLPDCATSHDPEVAGKCSLESIVGVAVSFANFLMGLAAAVFLAIFVWAGFQYIFFAYDPGVASKARQMLVNAAIGMLLVLGAATIVRFISSSATGREITSSDTNTSTPRAP